jgi:hypothetical protein
MTAGSEAVEPQSGQEKGARGSGTGALRAELLRLLGFLRFSAWSVAVAHGRIPFGWRTASLPDSQEISGAA